METVKDGNFDIPSISRSLMGRNTHNAVHFSISNFNEEEYISEEEAKKRREILERRPSYRRILNDLSASELDVKKEVDSNLPSAAVCNDSGMSVIQSAGLMNTAKLNGEVNLVSGLVVSPQAHSSLLQYSQAQELPGPSQGFVPSGGILGGLSLNRSMVHSLSPSSIGGPIPGTTALMSPSVAVASLHQDSPMSQHGGGGGDGTRKREMRLLKNREAAKECRRKKKEYVKCLENRVAVLENQNKALIEELKTLKELYCRKAD